MKTLFIDTETTSYNSDRCGLIQIAGIIEIDNKEVGRFDINSNIFIGDEVMNESLELNKISIKQINKFPKPKIAFMKFLSIMKKHINQYDKNDKFIVLAYKSEFDNTVLRNWFFKK